MKIKTFLEKIGLSKLVQTISEFNLSRDNRTKTTKPITAAPDDHSNDFSMKKNKNKSFNDKPKSGRKDNNHRNREMPEAAIAMSFLEANSNIPFTFKQITNKLQLETKSEKITLGHALEYLVKENRIIRVGETSYMATPNFEFITATVDFVNPRYAFLLRENGEDIKVGPESLHSALDGDTVKVRLYHAGRRGKVEAEVEEVIERRREEFVGRLEMSRNYAFVIPDNRKMHIDIFIPADAIGQAKHGDKVIVSITDFGDSVRNPEGAIKEVLGKAGENEAEMHSILAEFGLPYRFEEAIETEAEAISVILDPKEIARRRDFRNITTFTIDPIDAKDFDDALSLRKLDNGNWEIGVHIADVSYYVLPNSELEREAYSRATSVYLVDRVVPMLPEKLSNGLCSLRPNEDKFTFSAVFELDQNAKIHSEWFGRTVIHSDRRFSYEEVQEVIEAKQGDFVEEILLLNDLAYKLRADRFRKGSIGFETPEVRFKLDEHGKPLAVIPKERKDAHKLIEDFMLLANKKVAEFVYNLKKGNSRNTMVYRIHDAPDPAKMQTFSLFARRFGYKLNLDEGHVSESLNGLITDVEGKPEQNVLQSLAIRTMAKARYSTENVGHFGLAFKHYSHFTSPIRRYPDVICHRLLQHYLDGGESVEAAKIEAQCRHSSEMERRASEAERASIKYKQVEFMQLQEDKIFDGIISGVSEWGVYVEIIETKCEGMVRFADMGDDHYEHDKDNFRVVGMRTKRIISFGDKVQVRVKATNLEKRTIDLLLAGNSASEGSFGGGSRNNGRHSKSSSSKKRR